MILKSPLLHERQGTFLVSNLEFILDKIRNSLNGGFFVFS